MTCGLSTAAPESLRTRQVFALAAANWSGGFRGDILGQDGVVHEERDPLTGFGAFGTRAAEQFHPARGVGDKLRWTKCGDVIPEARFVHSVSQCLHSAKTLHEGVGQIRGNRDSAGRKNGEF